MTRHLLVVGAAVAAMALAACNQNTDESTVPGTPDANPAATVPTPADEASAPDYVQKAAGANMFEIQAAQVALRRSTNADVKAFAQMMIDDHTKAGDDMKAALAASGLAITPPAALPSDLQDKIDGLNSADAADFNEKYIDGQVDAHQDALNLQTRYAEDGDNAELKAFAAKVAPIIQTHLDKATAIRDALDKD